MGYIIQNWCYTEQVSSAALLHLLVRLARLLHVTQLVALVHAARALRGRVVRGTVRVVRGHRARHESHARHRLGQRFVEVIEHEQHHRDVVHAALAERLFDEFFGDLFHVHAALQLLVDVTHGRGCGHFLPESVAGQQDVLHLWRDVNLLQRAVSTVAVRYLCGTYDQIWLAGHNTVGELLFVFEFQISESTCDSQFALHSAVLDITACLFDSAAVRVSTQRSK